MAENTKEKSRRSSLWLMSGSRPKASGKKGIFLRVILPLLLAFFVFCAGYFVGVKVGVHYKVPANIKNATTDQSSVDFSLFWQTWNKAVELYIGSTDSQEMVYGAISGMIAALGDPYSDFLKPSDNQKFSADLLGRFDGIGAELITQNGQIVIVAPLAESPAEKAGLKAKDIILEIDGASTLDMSLSEAVDKIRGQAGTEVKLKILRSGSDNPLEFTITRANIKIESVTYQTVNVSGLSAARQDKKIAILKVNQFGDDTIDLANKYAGQIVADKADGIILDLRNNPGGYLQTSVDFVSLFLDSGKIAVFEVDKSGKKTEYKTSGDPILKNYPLVVLINGGSASAAEIVAGAIKDSSRGKIIGEKSFGKGSVQALEPLSAGAALKITVAKWLTPNGTEINKIGIAADIVVALSAADQSAGKDPQLDRAKSEIVK